jgi:metal-responsive CopG/Arc/MetJ family transcriptional regulator
MSIMHKNVHITMDEEVVKRVDAVRGDVSRSRFLQKIVERALRVKNK